MNLSPSPLPDCGKGSKVSSVRRVLVADELDAGALALLREHVEVQHRPGLSEGALRFEGLGTSGSFWPFNFSGPPVAADRWTHVAVTVEGGKRLTLFVDGKPAAMKDIIEDPKPNNEPIVIGREAWGGEEGPQAAAFFQGLMDEVKLWKRALTPEEVAAEAGG